MRRIRQDSEPPMPQPNQQLHPVYPVNVGAISNSRHSAPAPKMVLVQLWGLYHGSDSWFTAGDPQMTNRGFIEMYALTKDLRIPIRKRALIVTGMGHCRVQLLMPTRSIKNFRPMRAERKASCG